VTAPAPLVLVVDDQPIARESLAYALRERFEVILGATEKFTLSLPTYGASALRLRVKETGTPGGTLAVTGVAVRVGA
jgi:hypothetical protein